MGATMADKSLVYEILLKYKEALIGFKNTAASAKTLSQSLSQTRKDLNDTDKSLKSTAKSTGLLAKALQSVKSAGEIAFAFQNISTAVEGVGSALFGVGMQFQSTMDEVAAVGNLNLDTSEGQAAFAALEESARSAATTSKFTAIEAAEGLKYFSLAGFEASQSIAALPGMLNLAAATGADLAFTADLVSDQLTALKMSADEAGQLGDIFAKTVTSSNTSLEQLAEGVKYAGSVFAAVGFDAADLSAAMGKMSDSGIKASMAGTAARQAINSLAAPTRAAAELMDELGFSALNADGSLKEFPSLFEDLNQSLQGLSDVDRLAAITEIFGVEAATGMLALVDSAELLTDEFGNQSSELRKFRDELRKSEGTAASMMRTMTDNLSGDVNVFKSNVQELLITVFENIEPVLRGLTQLATTGVQVITGMVRGISNVLTALRDAFMDTFEPALIALAPLGAAINPLVVSFTQLFSNIKDGGTSMGAFAQVAAALGGFLGGVLSTVIVGLVNSLTFLGAAFAPIITEVQNFIAVFNQATDGLDFGEKIQLALSSGLAFVTNIDWAASGQAIIATLAQGVMIAGQGLYLAVASVFTSVRNLLPFSDAKEGAFSSLTENGRKIIETISDGVMQAAGYIRQSFEQVFADPIGFINTVLLYALKSSFVSAFISAISQTFPTVKPTLDAFMTRLLQAPLTTLAAYAPTLSAAFASTIAIAIAALSRFFSFLNQTSITVASLSQLVGGLAQTFGGLTQSLNGVSVFALSTLPKLLGVLGKFSVIYVALSAITGELGLWSNESLRTIPVVGELLSVFETLGFSFEAVTSQVKTFFNQFELTSNIVTVIEFITFSISEFARTATRAITGVYEFWSQASDGVKVIVLAAIAALTAGFIYLGIKIKEWLNPDYLQILVSETKKATQKMSQRFKKLGNDFYNAVCKKECDYDGAADKHVDSSKRATTRIGALFQNMWNKVALMGSSAMEQVGNYVSEAKLTGGGSNDKRTSAVIDETDRRAKLQEIRKYDEEHYDLTTGYVRKQTEEYKKLKQEVSDLGNKKRTAFQSIAVYAADAAGVISAQFGKAFSAASAAGNAFVVRMIAGFTAIRTAIVAGMVAIRGFVVALAVANPFTAMIVGAAAFAGLAYAIFSNWQTVVSLFQSIPSLIQSALGLVGNLISGLFGIVSDFLATFVSTGLASFVDAVGQLGVDITNLLGGAFDAVFLLLQGRFSKAGYALIETLGNGLLAGFDFLKSTFLSILEFFGLYLPHSDADQGPLSTLTASGASIPKTLGEGIAQGEQALTDAMDSMLNTSFDNMIAGAREKMVGFYEYLMPNNPEQYAGSLRETFANIFGQLLGDDQYKAAFIQPQKEEAAARESAQRVAQANKQALTGLLQQARELTNGRLSEARKQLSHVQSNLKQAAAEYKKYAQAAKAQEQAITDEKARQQSVINGLQSGNDVGAIQQIYDAEKQMLQKKAEFESKMAQAAMAQDMDRRNELLAQAEEIGRAYEQVAQSVMDITPQEESIDEIYIDEAKKRRVALKGVQEAHDLINQAMAANSVKAEEAKQKYADLEAEAKTLEGTIDGLKDLKADLNVDFSKPQEAAKQLQAVINQITLQDLDAQLNQLASSVGKITNGSQRTFDISTADAQQQVEALNQKYREAGGVIVSTKQSENELSQTFYRNIEQARAALQAKQDQWNAMDSAQQQGDAGKALQAETIELHKQIQAAEQLEGQKQLKVEADINQAQQALTKVQTQLDNIKDKTVTITTRTVEARSGGGMIGSAVQWTREKALHLSRGMKLSGYGGGDKIPAMLEAGEFVINKASTRMFSELLHAINYTPNTAKAMIEGVQGFNTGGLALPQMQLPQLQIPQMPMPNINQAVQGGGFTATLNLAMPNGDTVPMPTTRDALEELAKSMKGGVL